MPEMAKSSETKLFADDSLLFRTINNQVDSVLLQNDLTSLQDWEDKWQMSFQSFKLRRINPNVLLPLPIVLSMCLSQVRLLEMVTPRYLLASTVSNVCPCSL
jgi:hypothetical protein